MSKAKKLRSSNRSQDNSFVKQENSDAEYFDEDLLEDKSCEEFSKIEFDDEVMSPNESIDVDATIANLAGETVTNSADVRLKIQKGEFKICDRTGKSKVWNIFGLIETKSGEVLKNLVCCRTCLNIYKYNGKTTSNLVRHSCYVHAAETAIIPKIPVIGEMKKKFQNICLEWIIADCRSFEILQDAGFKKVAENLLLIAEKYSVNMDIDSLLPHPTSIIQNINHLHNIYFENLKTDLASIKNIGFGLTSELWNDSYRKKTYIALTIHYIKEAIFISRFLAINSMDDLSFTNANICPEIRKILNNMDLNLNEESFVVTDQNTNMTAVFHKNHHIFCINDLLHNALETAIQEVTDIADLVRLCTKLIKYFEINCPESFKSFPTSRLNKIYFLLAWIEKNWNEIVQLLQQKNERNRINNINFNHITAIVKVLQPFEDTLDKLDVENNSTIHLVYIYLHHLKKKCSISAEDFDIIKQLKETLNKWLDHIILEKLSIYHKIALFLFPPANKLTQFKEDEKLLIKNECKRLMRNYLQGHTVEFNNKATLSTETTGIANDINELFADFVQQPKHQDAADKINTELWMYENKNIIFYDNFNILKWWEVHQNDLPLLYKVSLKVLATPASSTASHKAFSVARNLISESKCSIASNDTESVSKIVFLHFNADKNELKKDLNKFKN